MPLAPGLNPLDAPRRSRLLDRLGPEVVRFDPDTCARYGHDETEDLAALPEAVALPTEVDQVVDLVRFAAQERVALTPRGAGTGLSGGALPISGGIAISLERLDRIRAVDEIDMVAEVEAGVTTARLQEAVEAKGLFYPPDPSSRDTCTLGGNLAEDAAGPRSLRYGTTRRYVLGLEAVLSDGTLVRTGGRCTKDVAGYDLTRLLVGSEGTLAVLTAAVLRLLPLPAARLTAVVGFESLESGAAAVAALCRAIPELAACELLERAAIEAVAQETDLPAPLVGREAALLVELHGASRDDLLAAAERLQEVILEHGGGELIVAGDHADERRLWDIRRRVGLAVKHRSVYKEADTVVPRSRLADLVRAARRVAAHHGLEAICYGHAGDGNLHVNLLRGDLPGPDWPARRDAAERDLFDEVVALGGSITGEHGIGLTQRHHLQRHLHPSLLAAMAGIKAAFDPQGILNPGKIFASEPPGAPAP